MGADMHIYGDLMSGNCFKVKMILDLTGQIYDWIDVDILKGESQTDDFLALNPNGKIPLLRLADGSCLAESNAILFYLAQNTDFLPKDSWEQGQILQWMFFEQYSHEPFIAVARFIQKYLKMPEDRQAEYQAKQIGGHKALAVMEKHLQDRSYFVGDRATIADIALYAYTHVAAEGGFDLSDYPAIQQWLRRIRALPNCPEMPAA